MPAIALSLSMLASQCSTVEMQDGIGETISSFWGKIIKVLAEE